jgi:hypothetical protein
MKRDRWTITVVLSAAALAVVVTADAEPKHTDWGAHRAIYEPRHVAHDPATDHPAVHALRDLYQEDQTFANLFSSTGQSEICGPTSMSNVLLYLKHNHSPAFPKLFNHVKDGGMARPVVEEMFRMCHTNRNTGTGSGDLKSCAAAALKMGGYEPQVLRDVGAFSDEAPLKRVVTPADLRAEGDRATVLLFGWYHRGTYKRNGGHFVALAGHDEKQANVAYVTNPLIKNYPKDHVYSKVVLEEIKGKPGGVPLAGMWQTEHLFGDSAGVIAVLEDMVSVLPRP